MPQENKYSSSTDSYRNEVRHPSNNESLNVEHEQPETIVNPQVEVMSSSNDFFWSAVIAGIVSVIILLVLRRLFLV